MAIADWSFPLVQSPTGRRFPNLVGARFGLLVVQEREPAPLVRQKQGHYWWRCECDCGNTHYVTQGNLLRLVPSKSCGCLTLRRPLKNPTLTAAVIERHRDTTDSKAQIARHFGVTKGTVMGILFRQADRPTLKLTPRSVVVFPGPNCCMFPQGDPLKPDFRFCGEKATKGSYCQPHYDRVYIKMS